MADGVVTVLGAVKRPQREAGTPAEEALALKTPSRRRWPKSKLWPVRPPATPSDMLAFQAAMLSDDELARPAFESISAGESASAAWEAAMADEISGYRAAEDAYFSARAADLEDIRDRVLGHLAPAADGAPIPGGSVVVAADLPLSRFLGIDWAQGGAIVLTEGSPTSHVAMLARARRVPMVVGLAAAADSMAGREALVDAASGEVVLDPTEDTRTAFAARAGRAEVAAAATAAFRQRPAVTKDGTAISVNLNAASADELEGIDPAICDGIGLVRTELMFYGPGGPPDEDAQYEAYRRILGLGPGPSRHHTDSGRWRRQTDRGRDDERRKQSVPRRSGDPIVVAPSRSVPNSASRARARGGAWRPARHAAHGDRAGGTRGGA